MKSRLYSLHPSIWDIIKIGMGIPEVDDENYNLRTQKKPYTTTLKPPRYYLLLYAGNITIR
jgi:hypothetical protein